MSARVFVTGAGMVSALGAGVPANLQRLRLAQTGIGPIQHLDTVHKGNIPTGEVPITHTNLLQLCGLPADSTGYTRTALLGMLAAQEAWGQRQATGIRVGLVSATSVGGMGGTEAFYPDFLKDAHSGDISSIATHDCGDSTEKIAQMLGITDYVTTISTACSSSANSIMLAARMIQQGLLDCVVAGGTDALTKFTLNGFNSLQILDHQWCQPFDERRRGLNLGEGAAYVVLESEELAMRHPERIWGILSGFGNANDAFHQTASSPDGIGARLAMQQALATSGLQSNDIDYINAHGTGTENNDLTEGLAIQAIFGERLPAFSSTKPYTGHTLAAAGALEAVVSLLSLQHGLIFPNLNFQQPMKEWNHAPVTETQEMAVRHVLSNSFGFGGNCSSLLFSKFEG